MYEMNRLFQALCVALLFATLMCEADEAANPRIRGSEYLKSNRFEEAIVMFDQLIQRNPQDRRGYRCRALAHLLAGSPEAAIKDFDEGIRLDNRDAVLYYGRACAYQLLGMSRRQLSDLEEAIRIDPGYDEARFSHALAAAEHNNIQGFITNVLNVIRSREKDEAKRQLQPVARENGSQDLGTQRRVSLEGFPTCRCWSLVYKEYRCLKRGLAVGGKIAGDTSRDPEAQRNSGIRHAIAHEHQKAIACITRSIELAPKESKYRKLRGALYVINRDFQAALDDFTGAIALNPEDIEPFLFRGGIYLAMRDYKKLIENDEELARVGEQRDERLRKWEREIDRQTDERIRRLKEERKEDVGKRKQR